MTEEKKNQFAMKTLTVNMMARLSIMFVIAYNKKTFIQPLV